LEGSKFPPRGKKSGTLRDLIGGSKTRKSGVFRVIVISNLVPLVTQGDHSSRVFEVFFRKNRVFGFPEKGPNPIKKCCF